MDPFSGLPFDLQLEQLKRYCNGDGSIDVDGDVFIDSCNLTKIPFKFRNVSRGFNCSSNNRLISLEGAPISIFNFWCDGNNSNIPYSEIFKIVDRVKGSIYYSSRYLPEDKIKRDRDVKTVLKDNELGSLNV